MHRRPTLRLRRRTRTVIWGGRPDLDRWVGSAHDLRLEAIGRYFRELERRRAAQAVRVLANLSATSADVVAKLRETQAALERAAGGNFRQAVLALAEADRLRQERLRASLQRATVAASLESITSRTAAGLRRGFEDLDR